MRAALHPIRLTKFKSLWHPWSVALITTVIGVVAVAMLAPATAAADSRTASFTYPLNGASSVDTSKAFSWTSVSGAQAYYLYVGTSQGAQDLVDSAEAQSTSYQVPPLPAG